MWIDVLSSGIPRNTTEISVLSFLRYFQDRSDFKLRWVFHLDRTPPHLPEYADYYDENLALAKKLAKLFDSSIIIEETENQLYGGSVYALLQHVENRVLWAEDDKQWLKEFSLRRAMEVSLDGNKFVYFAQMEGYRRMKARYLAGRSPVLAGATCPALWAEGAPEYLRDNFPPIKNKVSEIAIIGIFQHGKYESTYYDEGCYGRDMYYTGSKFARKWYDPNIKGFVQISTMDEALEVCGWTEKYSKQLNQSKTESCTDASETLS